MLPLFSTTNDKDVHRKIKEKYGGEIQFAYDTVCTDGSQALTQASVSDDQTVKLFASLTTKLQQQRPILTLYLVGSTMLLTRGSSIQARGQTFFLLQERLLLLNWLSSRSMRFWLPKAIKHMPLLCIRWYRFA